MNKQTSVEKLAILGSGPAGLTAALYAARAGLNPLIIEGNKPGGQLMSTTYVENWPGTDRILGPSLIANMRKHAMKFGARFIVKEVTQLDFSNQPFSLITDNNKQPIKAHTIIIATGSTYKKLNIPGEEEYWNKGVGNCSVCEGPFYKNKRVLIVGGGDTGAEAAIFMTNYTDKITIIQNFSHLTASQVLRNYVLNHPAITIFYDSMVTAIEGDGKKVTHAIVTNNKTQEKQALEVDGIFIAIGTIPNTSIFQNVLELDTMGYIIVKDEVHTSIPGIFAAGDVIDNTYKQAVTAAGKGCMAALSAERYLKNILAL